MSAEIKWQNLNAYELHKTLINEYFLTARSKGLLLKRNTSEDKRDIDVIRENHQFLWEEIEGDLSWEKRLAKKYYDKLFKEYCVSDLSRYKENKIGLRWRTEQELINGKGQFSCGDKKCNVKEDLRTWEVNFGYVEQDVKKNALVKLRLCPGCSFKLNYHHKKKEVRRLKPNKFNAKKVSNLQDPKSEKSEKNKETIYGKEKAEENEENSKFDGKVSDVWKQRNVAEEEGEAKTREEEFEEYLDQLFL